MAANEKFNQVQLHLVEDDDDDCECSQDPDLINFGLIEDLQTLEDQLEDDCYDNWRARHNKALRGWPQY